MNLQEAALQGLQQKKGITRKSWMPKGPLIIPTNTKSGCIIEPYSSKEPVEKRWQPSFNDLIADDWIPMGALDERN
jgi:hypothetical protein